ncbi:MAG: acetate/propionate family kinase [Myxococcota bacterium]
MNVLVLNCGSSSLKYKVVDASGSTLFQGRVERIGEAGLTHADAVQTVVQQVSDLDIGAVGHRVVHGGERFFASIQIDEDVKSAINACIPLASLHVPANMAGIDAAQAAFPDAAHVAVFDTAFHVRMPRRSRTYALDPAVAEPLSIRRFGFHGTSHAYVADRAAEFLGQPVQELRLISLHLGNGASACAIEYGKSVDTSMGMTPLEGLVMGTRCGDLDPGAVLALVREHGVDATDTLLNRNSGLAGLSGHGPDLRDIQAAASDGDDRARLAINVFAHRVRKAIGAYAAVLGGVDAVILTGGIGQNSASMRRRILQRLDFLGLRFDDDHNDDASVDDARPVAEISAANSRVKALVIATDEERRIAQETRAVLQAEPARPRPIPIAVSARHVHVDRAAMDALFGPGAELEPDFPLSQPGQYASKQRVNLIGPRGRIERVRILGPLRPASQVEVSRTDEFALGVDAPIRRSGKVQGSAPITLEGPHGTVHLEQGLICAWRHIHMTTDDATYYGVSDGDRVEVSVRGGERDLTFGDVLVRVKDSYVLEMHIDTDEANAAELPRHSHGALIYEPAPDAIEARITRQS